MGLDKHKVKIVHRDEIPETPFDYTEKSVRVIQRMIEDALGEITDGGSLFYGREVLFKPNIVRAGSRTNPTITTDPRAIAAMARLLRDAGASRVIVGENPGFGLPARIAFQQTGLIQPLADAGASISFFDEEEPITLESADTRLFHGIKIPRIVREVDIYISFPKMKTHIHTLVSLGIKNQIGLLYDDQRMLFHRCDINEKIVDIYRLVQPDFTVVEGVWATEGQAPFHGDSIKNMNVIVAGENALETDAVAAYMMGIDACEVTHFRIARQNGFGETDPGAIDFDREVADRAKRKFKRPILSSAGAFEGICVVEGGCCSGCLSALRHSLDKLEAEGALDKLRGRVTIFAGKPMPNIENLRTWRGDLWLFSSCAAEMMFSSIAQRETIRYIPGCPPHVLDLYKKFVEVY